MECVCLLLDVPTSWDSAKKVLGDTQFMQKLINYDKDNMDRKIVKKMLKYYDDPEFTPENVQRVSNAAKSLCMWCRAMKVYDDVAQVVEPKRLVLAENKAKLEEMESKLAKVQANLKEVVDKVDALTLALTPNPTPTRTYLLPLPLHPTLPRWTPSKRRATRWLRSSRGCKRRRTPPPSASCAQASSRADC